MELWQAGVLGLLQGLGEFLPISSSAHLILAPYFFDWEDPGLAFDAALHLGTLAALLAYFGKDWLKIIADGLSHLSFRKLLAKDREGSTVQRLGTDDRLLWWILIASIPGALAGFFLESWAETIFRNPRLIAMTLAGFGLVLWVAQRFAKNGKVNFVSAVIIGLAQALAIVPGVSRSGATISAGMFLGLSKYEAARFSFLLGTPIVLGAGLFSLRHLDEILQPALIISFLVSAVTGFLAIKFLLKWISKMSYTPFVVYRLLLAVVILLILTFSK